MNSCTSVLDLLFQQLSRAAGDDEVIGVAHEVDLGRPGIAHRAEKSRQLALQTVQCQVR
jgi:high-affinity K+ transport system ATPase subunit B